MTKPINCHYYLFDYDGTICNTIPTIQFALAATFAEFNLAVPDEQERSKAISAGLTLHDTFAVLSPISAPILGEMVKKYREIYLQNDERLTVLFDGASKVFTKLKAAGKKIVVLSNKGIAAVENSLKYHGLYPLADLIVAEGILPKLKLKAKPDPMMYEMVIKKHFNIANGHEVLMTGDTHADLLFAKNCGLLSCWAAYGYGKRSDCEALHPDYTVNHIDELLHLTFP